MGSSLHQNVQHLPEQTSRGEQDQQPYDYAKYWVYQLPAKEQGQHAGPNHGQGAQQIAYHVEERPFYVDAFPSRFVEHPRRRGVDRQAHDSGRQHYPALGLDSTGQTPESLEKYQGSNQPQGQCVQQGGQDLGAVETERALDGSGTSRQPDGHQRHADGRGVGDHVDCVGQQGQAVGHQSGGHLHHHEGGDQRQRDYQPTPAGRPGGAHQSTGIMERVVHGICVGRVAGQPAVAGTGVVSVIAPEVIPKFNFCPFC